MATAEDLATLSSLPTVWPEAGATDAVLGELASSDSCYD